MSLDALEELMEAKRGGVWHLAQRPEPKAVQKAAKGSGYAYFHIDCRNITRKEQLLNSVATTLRFPKHFGHNWDALEECLVDMEWVEGDGYVLFFDHLDGFVEANPEQCATLVEILRDAVASWKEDDEAMIVLLSGAKAPKGVSKLKSAEAD